MNGQEIQSKALNILRQEKTAWENEKVFITDKVAFNMRNLIRLLRKNYWGVFTKEIDPVTKRKKTFIPLTQSITEFTVKNIDLDTKDISLQALFARSIPFVNVLKNSIKSTLDKIYFGMKLDQMLRTLAIDGTAVWKTTKKKGKDGKWYPEIRLVDLLNWYIDPTVESIEEAESVIERMIVSKDEFKKLAEKHEFINVEEVAYTKNPSRSDSMLYNNNFGSTVDFVELYERWGKVPKYLVSGNDEDTDLIDAHIIASGTNGSWRIHLIEEYDGKKPYEEAWYSRVPNRWYGMGVAEKLLSLQEYLNMIVNIRINRSMVSQLGLFKIRKGAGFTAQMFSRLAANGVIQVNNMDDIQQLVVDEASEASYKDEQNILDWSRFVTSSFESTTGESLPSSTTATSAMIQSNAGQSTFTLIKEGVGFMLERWVRNHLFPIINKNLNYGEVLRMTEDANDLAGMDDYFATALISEDVKNGKINSVQEFETKRAQILEKLRTMNNTRFVKMLDKINYDDYDVRVIITNEKIDTGVLQANLIEALKVAQPQNQEIIIAKLFDMMGIPYQRQMSQQQQQVPQEQLPNPSPVQNQQQMAFNSRPINR